MSGRKKIRELTEDERIVWSTVARTVKPLRPVPEADMQPPQDRRPPEPPAMPDLSRPFLPPYIPPQSRPAPPTTGRSLDRSDRQKLASGKTEIEARLDLHGMIQSQAHALLQRFLLSCQMRGIRHVLVITGKGSAQGSDGVLRRMVPQWLATQPFSGMVSSHAPADRRHGGAGALYVRLRRTDGAGSR